MYTPYEGGTDIFSFLTASTTFCCRLPRIWTTLHFYLVGIRNKILIQTWNSINTVFFSFWVSLSYGHTTPNPDGPATPFALNVTTHPYLDTCLPHKETWIKLLKSYDKLKHTSRAFQWQLEKVGNWKLPNFFGYAL